MRRYPGEVYTLPPAEEAEGDPKYRPHLLLNECDSGDAFASFAFASTSGLEASYGATHAILNPYSTAYRGTGFQSVSIVYLSRIVCELADNLASPLGKVIDEMPKIRRYLETALGLGTGTARGAGPAAGSLRGLIVEFSRGIIEQIETPYGIVVCEPRYSREQRYVNVVPIYGLGFQPLDGDLVVEDAEWLRAIESPAQAIIAFRQIQAVFYPDQVSRPLDTVVDDVTMNQVDDALRRHFGL